MVVVCGEDGGMVGVITKTDIAGQITWCAGSGCTARVDTIMTLDVVSCRPNEALQGIWSVMKARGLQRIPVLDANRTPHAVIYARDALQCLMGKVESDEALLRDYVMDVGYQ